MNFGKNFYWGTATASYQIEGAHREDGRTDSIWDTFSHKDGAVIRGEHGDTACDHYHRLEEDLNYVKELGCNAYRFSISWSRLMPNGCIIGICRKCCKIKAVFSILKSKIGFKNMQRL